MGIDCFILGWQTINYLNVIFQSIDEVLYIKYVFKFTAETLLKLYQDQNSELILSETGCSKKFHTCDPSSMSYDLNKGELVSRSSI